MISTRPFLYVVLEYLYMGHRLPTIIGNWKMNKTVAETRSFISALALSLENSHVKLGLAVPFTSLAAAKEASHGTSMEIGAQSVSEYDDGAYTGEISCEMVKDAGASFSLIGHSERRRLFFENDSVVNKKIKKALESELKVVCCIGETLEENLAGKAREVLKRQLMIGLQGLTLDQVKWLSIAYEPVWAIGSNQAATPDIAQERHSFCRECLEQEWGKNLADLIAILYGGSVNSANAEALLKQSDVDGLLVGGASLSLDSFSKILLVGV